MNLQKLSHFIASQAVQPFTAFVKIEGKIRPWTFFNGDLVGHTLIALAKDVFDSDFAWNIWKERINSIEIETHERMEAVSLAEAVAHHDTEVPAIEPEQVKPAKKRGR